MPQKFADEHDVNRKVAEWGDDVLECRTYGHQWQPLRAVQNKRHAYYYVVQLCHRCTTERHMELTRTFHVLASWMKYPDGYLTEGLGRIAGEARDVLRGAAIMRTFPLVTLSSKEARETLPHSKATREYAEIDIDSQE